MKTIHLSNKIVSIIFALKNVLLGLYILLGLLCVFLCLFLDGYAYIGLWWMLGFLLIYVIAKLTKKPTVYLTKSIISARHYINDAYWLKVAYVKKMAINETIYDVVYFDNDSQVMTETLSEALFKRKIGENSTHYKATKQNATTFLETNRINTVVTLLQLPFLEIGGEVVLDLYDFSDPYGRSSYCIIEELVQRFEVIQYDQKRIDENYIEYLKNVFLEHLVVELNRMNTKYHFELLTLSPETHKTDTLGESSIRE